MSYEVFARKYRPQTFADVVGQEHITRTLRNAIEQHRLAHAYIFVGPRGTGKTSTARILAKSLNCERSPVPTVTPCGECDSCREIAAGNSLDVLEFDAASNTQVDKVREIIIDNVKYAPARGRYKVYIVDEVHMLSASSFNALLKTLEEPPSHVKFVFATTDVQKVPTTIISRCQRFDLKRIPTGLIAGHLLKIAANEQIALAPEASEAIARAAEGGMRDAESMLDQLVAFCGQEIAEADVLSVFGLSSRQNVSDLCGAILAGDVSGALAIVHEQAEAGRDLSRLMADLIVHLRNVLIAQADSGALAEDLSPEAIAALDEQAAQVRMEKLLELIEQLAAAEGRMRWSPNRKMHMEVAIIRATQVVAQASLGEVLETIDALRRGEAPPSASAPTPRPPAARPAPRAAASAPKAAPAQVPEPAKPAAKVEAPKTEAAAPAPAPVPVPVPVPVPEAVVPTPVAPPPEPKVEEAAPMAKAPAAKAPEPSPSSSTEEEESPFYSEDEAPAPIPVAAAPAPPTVGITPQPAAAAGAEVDLAITWAAVLKTVAEKRPGSGFAVRAGVLKSISGGTALIATANELNADRIAQPQTRQIIEAALTEALGRDMAVKTQVEPGLEIPAPPEPEAPRPASQTFREDPLIQKALDIFKAKIQPA